MNIGQRVTFNMRVWVGVGEGEEKTLSLTHTYSHPHPQGIVELFKDVSQEALYSFCSHNINRLRQRQTINKSLYITKDRYYVTVVDFAGAKSPLPI